MDSLKNNRIQPVSTPPTLQEQTDLLRAYRSGFQAAHVIATGIQLGLFEQLASRPQGVTYQALSQGTGYHAPYVRVWCSTAYHYHLLEVDERGRYRLAPHMDALLDDRTNLDSLASLFTNAVGRQGPQMAQYSEYVKSGETGSHAEAYGNNPDRHDPPSSTVAIQRRMWVEQLIPKAPDLEKALNNGGKVLDVGCGPGVLLTILAEMYPSASFVGVDVVEVGGLNTARRLIVERGLEDRVSVQKMKVEDMTFREEFDGITLTNVFHELLPVERRETVIGVCFQAIKRPGALLIRDMAYPSTLEGLRDPDYASGVYNQYQEMAWGTIHPTREDRQGWFAKAGFTSVEHYLVPGIASGMQYFDIARKL